MEHHDLAHYSAGRWLLNQVYIVGWSEIDVVKAGFTSIGRDRYGSYLARGGQLLYLESFTGLEALNTEHEIHEEMARRWALAFEDKPAAAAHLGRNGAGFSECFHVPAAQWPDVLAIAKEAAA